MRGGTFSFAAQFSNSGHPDPALALEADTSLSRSEAAPEPLRVVPMKQAAASRARRNPFGSENASAASRPVGGSTRSMAPSVVMM